MDEQKTQPIAVPASPAQTGQQAPSHCRSTLSNLNTPSNLNTRSTASRNIKTRNISPHHILPNPSRTPLHRFPQNAGAGRSS